jgi:hypothetical protein
MIIPWVHLLESSGTAEPESGTTARPLPPAAGLTSRLRPRAPGARAVGEPPKLAIGRSRRCPRGPAPHRRSLRCASAGCSSPTSGTGQRTRAPAGRDEDGAGGPTPILGAHLGRREPECALGTEGGGTLVPTDTNATACREVPSQLVRLRSIHDLEFHLRTHRPEGPTLAVRRSQPRTASDARPGPGTACPRSARTSRWPR